ncbi:hypothetical protein AYO20_08400 [Fonsecaea nubica]|uniref:Uncharacterized protein n=1 Tax=Fonsecaea nubica TaxID=856822 RepID=A0A178CMN3_9EURO|nr:hypothetical protein AYO20_08400 [Fonsecaea nubica]OAL31069.1 hypothetical protein AYO20_08400 [Fonsecaea nubica]
MVFEYKNFLLEEAAFGLEFAGFDFVTATGLPLYPGTYSKHDGEVEPYFFPNLIAYTAGEPQPQVPLGLDSIPVSPSDMEMNHGGTARKTEDTSASASTSAKPNHCYFQFSVRTNPESPNP